MFECGYSRYSVALKNAAQERLCCLLWIRRTIRLSLFSKETRENTKERAKGLEMVANHKVVDSATMFFFF